MVSVASWNIRGLNRTPKQNEVRQVVNENHLSICAILESHVDISCLERICAKVFRKWNWTSNGALCDKGSHIILGWDPGIVDVMIISQTDQVMHTQVLFKAERKVAFFTFIYAANAYKTRRILWQNLEVHKSFVSGQPWVLMGDFNASLNLEDCYAGSSLTSIAMREFKECVCNIEVSDVNASGLHYTWNQKPKGSDGVLKKIDRVMANMEYLEQFTGSYAIFQPYRIFDHSPAGLKIPNLCKSKPKPFKFANLLVFKPSFIEVVQREWGKRVEGHTMFQIVTKMKNLKTPFRKLLMEQGNLHDRVVRLRHELEEA